MPVEDAAGDQRGHRRHLVEREADAVHLDVVGEAVHADLRQVNAGRAVNAQRHVEVDGGGVERVEVGVVEVAGLQRRRDEGRDQPELLGFAHDVDGHLAVLDRGHGDAAQPATRRGAVVGDPLVVEPRESRGELGILEAGRAQPEARIQHHRVDVIAVGVAEHALGGSAVDAVGGWRGRARGGSPRPGRWPRDSCGLRCTRARPSVRGLTCSGQRLHRFERERRVLGDVSISIDDSHVSRNLLSRIAC